MYPLILNYTTVISYLREREEVLIVMQNINVYWNGSYILTLYKYDIFSQMAKMITLSNMMAIVLIKCVLRGMVNNPYFMGTLLEWFKG